MLDDEAAGGRTDMLATGILTSVGVDAGPSQIDS